MFDKIQPPSKTYAHIPLGEHMLQTTMVSEHLTLHPIKKMSQKF